jgi:hypothetical protein
MIGYRPTPRSKRPRPVWQLHIRLDEIEPAIWRRIQIYSNVKLPRLHKIIQTLFNWEDYHLHEWVIGRRRFTDMSTVDPDLADNSLDEHDIDIGHLLSEAGDSLLYRYDFGDNWRHVVLLEGILVPEEDACYPRCIAGARNGPPEDCGGTRGYGDYVDALAKPEHPRHEEMLEWRGVFEPEAFSLRRINAALRRISGQRPIPVAPPAQPPGPLVRVMLAQHERDLILKRVRAPRPLIEPVRAAPATAGGAFSARISAGGLDELIGYVTAEARLARRERLRMTLFQLACRLDGVLSAQAPKPPPFLIH